MYNPNIPIGDDSPKNQAPLIQTDFSQFATVFSTTIASNKYNHSPINTSVVNSPNQGDHETIILQNQVTTDPTIDDNFVCLYSKDATSNLGTQPQLFLRLPKYLPNQYIKKNPGNPPMQLTYNQVNIAGPIFQSFLPGGYLIFWGATTMTNPATSRQITLPIAPTKILIAIAYGNSAVASGGPRRVSVNIDTNTKFTIYSSSFSGTQPFNFFVVATV